MPSSFETTHETTIKEDLARLQCQLDQLGPEKRNALLWFLLKVLASFYLLSTSKYFVILFAHMYSGSI